MNKLSQQLANELNNIEYDSDFSKSNGKEIGSTNYFDKPAPYDSTKDQQEALEHNNAQVDLCWEGYEKASHLTDIIRKGFDANKDYQQVNELLDKVLELIKVQDES